MLDIISGKAGAAAAGAIGDQLRTLYRARPFTKAVPFNQILGPNPVSLWKPVNAYFEVAIVTIRSNLPLVDLVLLDTSTGQPFLFVMPPVDRYQHIDLSPGYRSLMYSGAELFIWDPANTGAQVKGVVYGWEVTPDGYYR